MTAEPESTTRSGLVAVLGRPNVGKSTLVNALVGEKVSIVTHKPQTTRHRIVGVVTSGACQIGLVDTPGLHGGQVKALNRVLNATAAASLDGVDAGLLVIEALRWSEDDERALAVLGRAGIPAGLVVNKVDRVQPKASLLPFLEQAAARHHFAFVLPVSARKGDNLKALIDELCPRMPPGAFRFPADEYTDRDLRFLAAEAVREQLTLALHQELPYALAVTVDDWDQDADQARIQATVWVAKSRHRAMVIGHGGQMLKQIGRRARLDLAQRLGLRVDLRLWVKLREDWPANEAAVRELGH